MKISRLLSVFLILCFLVGSAQAGKPGPAKKGKLSLIQRLLPKRKSAFSRARKEVRRLHKRGGRYSFTSFRERGPSGQVLRKAETVDGHAILINTQGKRVGRSYGSISIIKAGSRRVAIGNSAAGTFVLRGGQAISAAYEGIRGIKGSELLHATLSKNRFVLLNPKTGKEIPGIYTSIKSAGDVLIGQFRTTGGDFFNSVLLNANTGKKIGEARKWIWVAPSGNIHARTSNGEITLDRKTGAEIAPVLAR